MGASNVKAVFEMWPDLPNTAFRLLVHMALVSKDADNPPRYWGGREDMAEALGRKVPPANDGDAEVTRQRNAAFKAVRECTTLLTKRGAIVPLKKAWTGQRQEWALNLRHGLHENRAPLPEAEVHENRAPVDGPEREDGARLVHEKRAERCTENVQEAHENRADWCTETVPPRRREEERGEPGVSQSERAPEPDRPPTASLDGLTDPPSRAHTQATERTARRSQGRRELHQAYGLNDAEADQAMAVCDLRSPKPIRSYVKYLRGMKANDRADIIEAIQLGDRRRQLADAVTEPEPEPAPEPPPAPPAEPEPEPGRDPDAVAAEAAAEREKARTRMEQLRNRTTAARLEPEPATAPTDLPVCTSPGCDVVLDPSGTCFICQPEPARIPARTA